MTVTPISVAKQLKIADANASIRHVFIHDMVIDCLIGVYNHEKENKQKVRLNLDLAVTESGSGLSDELEQVVCYDVIAEKVRSLASAGHVNLVETFAENIAEMCLDDRRVRSVRVRVEKLEALEDADSVGVEIERLQV